MSEEKVIVVQGLSLPARRKSLREYKYPFATMEVGEMFFIPEGGKGVVNQASAAGKELGRKFATRVLFMRRKGRSWEVCTSDMPDGQQGVGVWRMK